MEMLGTVTLLFSCLLAILSSLTTVSNSTIDLFFVSTLWDKLDFSFSEDDCILRTSASAVRHCCKIINYK